MMLLTSSFFLVEIIVGYLTNSMALVADSFHMLSDVASLIVGFCALKYSTLGKRTHKYTFGYVRSEVLGALVNAVFLVALCFSIFVESMKRMVIPEDVENPILVLIVGSLGLFVNIIGLFLFHQHGHSHGGHGHSHDSKMLDVESGDSPQSNDIKVTKQALLEHETLLEDSGTDVVKKKVDTSQPLVLDDDEEGEYKTEIGDKGEETLVLQTIKNKTAKKEKLPKKSAQLNIRGVYLHVLGDALGSVIVIINALVIHFASCKWTMYIDPVMSILMVMIILKTSIPLLKESSMILMQTVPTHLKIQEIQEKLMGQIDGVISIHEFHIWQLSGNKIIASAHVRCQNIHDYMAIANDLKEFFHNEGIHSTTIQPEFEDNSDSDDGCILKCGPEKDCAQQTCCGPDQADASTKQKESQNRIRDDDKLQLT